ncbi:LOB DOMAIN-CONTAINING PROTEIN 4-RELATED [Salix purpurea]|uniref:LOB DOMAIN-CONTAINING PROTEIN 4-RELATED n=1 Tax=Salix purpurea TaxID=77065 RepID=A0A9Q0ZMP3_SALPP|nr:LOB DOMAIN-CONTAINING PROTEIN 4-RELATED [Salix purpurea]
MTKRPRCGACRNLDKECKKNCIFAPYFPPEKSQEFSLIQQVYSEKEVEKLLKKHGDPTICGDILESLLYEARARLENPVCGSAGYVYCLQQQIVEAKIQLCNAKRELSSYIGEELAGFPTYIPPIRLQNQLNPPSSFPSPPILKSSPYAAVKWDLPKFDRKEIDIFTAAATLHHQGIPTTTETLTSSPYAAVNNTDHRSSQIDESPANYCLITAPVTEGTAPNANEWTF